MLCGAGANRYKTPATYLLPVPMVCPCSNSLQQQHYGHIGQKKYYHHYHSLLYCYYYYYSVFSSSNYYCYSSSPHIIITRTHGSYTRSTSQSPTTRCKNGNTKLRSATYLNILRTGHNMESKIPNELIATQYRHAGDLPKVPGWNRTTNEQVASALKQTLHYRKAEGPHPIYVKA